MIQARRYSRWRSSIRAPFFLSLRSFATSASLRYLFLLFFFRPRSSKKTFALFRIHSHPSPIDARHSSLHNAPTLQTGNRSSPENRPRHLKKITEQRIPCKLNLARQKGSVLS